MFVKNTRRGYTRGGQQKASGKFLIVCDDPNDSALRPELRACVLSVTLEQCGHWMMGDAYLEGHRITLSGTYGGDGLPVSLKAFSMVMAGHIWEHLTPLPPDLQEIFWNGGGHNCAGVEGPAMRDWALENLKELTR